MGLPNEFKESMFVSPFDRKSAKTSTIIIIIIIIITIINWERELTESL